MSSKNCASSNFETLQPLCVAVARSCTLENINKLETALKGMNENVLTQYQEYIIFPFRLVLARKVNEVLTIRCLEFLSGLFSRSKTESLKAFSNTFLQLCSLISFSQDSEKQKSASEETKTCICQCLTNLICSACKDIQNEIYEPAFRLNLAQAFFALIDLLKNEKSKSLQIAALNTIGILTYNSEYFSLRSDDTRELVSEALVAFFPGLCIGLQTPILKSNQSHVVIRTSLKILVELIVMITSDDCLKTKQTKNSPKVSIANLPFIIRDDNWIKDTALKLYIIIKNLSVLVGHNNVKVRLDYIDFGELILCNCTKTLENCFPLILSNIFALSVDSHTDVTTRAQSLIKKISLLVENTESISLGSIIKDNIYTATTELIKSKISANDSNKLCILKSLQGYLQVLGSTIDNLLVSTSHLERIILSLMNILELDISNICLIEDITGHIICTSIPLWPTKKFKHFQSINVFNTVENICFLLGQSSHCTLVVDYLLENLHGSDLYHLQSILLVGFVVEGMASSKLSNGERFEIVQLILDDLLPLMNLGSSNKTSNQALQVHNNEVDIFPHARMFSGHDIYQICFILESISKCAKALQKNFCALLMDVIFPVMEKAGSSQYMISQSGKNCLYSIAAYCGYSSALDMIQDNADYVTSSIATNFHYFFHRPEMAVVIRVVLEESDERIFPFFKEPIFLLLKNLDHNQDKVFMLLSILKSVLIFIGKWFPNHKRKDDVTSDTKHELPFKVGSLSKCDVSDHEAIKKDYDRVENMEEDYEGIQEPVKQDLHVTVICEILQRCSKLQSHHNLYTRVLTLEVLSICVTSLGGLERQLDPLVHQLWSAFIHRFSEETVIVLEAFKVLLAIAEECRDFIRVRVLRDIFPKITKILKNQFTASLLKNYREYQWTKMCKLHILILAEVGNLFTKLDVCERDIANLSEVTLPYLNKVQPRVFREACAKTIEALISIDPDAMWLFYNQMYSEKPIWLPPSEKLLILKFPDSSNSATDIRFTF